MPEISGADQITFFIVNSAKAAEVESLKSDLTAFAAVSREKDEVDEDALEAARLSIERLSNHSIWHGLTIFPEGNPAYEYYIEKNGLLDSHANYDPSVYQDHLYGHGIELAQYPLYLVNVFDEAGILRLLSAMRDLLSQKLFAAEREELATVLATLSQIDAAKSIVILWYVQWT